MSRAGKKLLAGIALLLAAGAAIGLLYGRFDLGLLVAALAILAWLLRQLLFFDQAVRTGDFDNFRYGEGIWQQLIARYQRQTESVISREKSYRKLLREVRKSTNALPDGAVILKSDNEIIGCNRAAKRLAGLRRKKDRGQRVDNILRDPELARLLETDEQTVTIEMPSPTIDGIWLNCRVVPYGADQKLLLLRDVTERNRLSKMRRDFVANASHELRSPLTVISGYIDSIADAPDIPSDWVKPVQQMRGQARRMRKILGELLELSRLESAGDADTTDVVEVATLFEDAKTAFEGHADIADIVINIESDIQLSGNPAEIETVIVNLLSNAVRYTPRDGQITLTLRADAKGADLIVEDTGEGIDPKYIPRLTERFFRVDKGRSREQGGTGLGLAIVKHVLARHGAELIITSEPGQGSQFRCHFPADRIIETPPAA
jgi:two-component system phosphate regulon sensor histidine kinase PhoR